MTVLLKETRTAYRHYNLFTVYSYDAMLYSLDMIHVCAVFLQWCMFISNSYTCLYACVSGASCHFRSHQVMQDNYFLCRLAILRRHCPEPAADAGVEWWTLCLDAWKQKSAHHNSAWRILNEFLAQVSLRKKHSDLLLSLTQYSDLFSLQDLNCTCMISCWWTFMVHGFVWPPGWKFRGGLALGSRLHTWKLRDEYPSYAGYCNLLVRRKGTSSVEWPSCIFMQMLPAYSN